MRFESINLLFGRNYMCKCLYRGLNSKENDYFLTFTFLLCIMHDRIKHMRTSTKDICYSFLFHFIINSNDIQCFRTGIVDRMVNKV